MQKVIHVDYSSRELFEQGMKEINSLLEDKWKVVSTQAVCQMVSQMVLPSSYSNCYIQVDPSMIKGDYGVTFIIEKD